MISLGSILRWDSPLFKRRSNLTALGLSLLPYSVLSFDLQRYSFYYNLTNNKIIKATRKKGKKHSPDTNLMFIVNAVFSSIGLPLPLEATMFTSTLTDFRNTEVPTKNMIKGKPIQTTRQTDTGGGRRSSSQTKTMPTLTRSLWTIVTSAFSKSFVFTVHTTTGKQDLRMYPHWSAFSQSCVFGDRRRWISVEGRPNCIKKYPFSNENGLVWTGPKTTDGRLQSLFFSKFNIYFSKWYKLTMKYTIVKCI